MLWGIAYVLWVLLWLAFTLLVRLPLYLLVLLPLSLLGLRRRPQPPEPPSPRDATACLRLGAFLAGRAPGRSV